MKFIVDVSRPNIVARRSYARVLSCLTQLKLTSNFNQFGSVLGEASQLHLDRFVCDV